MANEILVKVGGQLTFADHGTDFAGGAAKTSLEQVGSSDVQINLKDVADTAGRESAKVDLGAVRAARYSVVASFEFAATPVSGDSVEIFWAPSPEAAAANGNINSIDGVDAAAPSGVGTIGELTTVCQFIGVFVCTNDPTPSVQTAYVGTFSPAERYGILVVKNESGAAFHSDAVEIHIVFNPIIDEVQ